MIIGATRPPGPDEIWSSSRVTGDVEWIKNGTYSINPRIKAKHCYRMTKEYWAYRRQAHEHSSRRGYQKDWKDMRRNKADFESGISDESDQSTSSMRTLSTSLFNIVDVTSST